MLFVLSFYVRCESQFKYIYLSLEELFLVFDLYLKPCNQTVDVSYDKLVVLVKILMIMCREKFL